jgi:hypothetical protein
MDMHTNSVEELYALYHKEYLRRRFKDLLFADEEIFEHLKPLVTCTMAPISRKCGSICPPCRYKRC